MSATCHTHRHPGRVYPLCNRLDSPPKHLPALKSRSRTTRNIPTGIIMPQPDGISDERHSSTPGRRDGWQGRVDVGGNELPGGLTGFGPNAGAPRKDWEQKRFGAMAPATSIQLWEGAMLAVLAALGVPPSLYTSQGAALRESYRHLFGSTIEPLAHADSSGAFRETGRGSYHQVPGADTQRCQCALAGVQGLRGMGGSHLSRCTRCSGSRGMRRPNRSRSPPRRLCLTRALSQRRLPPLVATGQPDWQPWYHRGNLPEGLVIAGLH